MSGNETRHGRVAGKRVLITGAARGMGRTHAVRLAETARLVEKHSRCAITHVVDVRDTAALAAAVDDGVAQLGGLDAAVANAGVLTVGTWDKTTQKQWRTVLDVNLIGTRNTCAAALPHLVGRGASPVNIHS